MDKYKANHIMNYILFFVSYILLCSVVIFLYIGSISYMFNEFLNVVIIIITSFILGKIFTLLTKIFKITDKYSLAIIMFYALVLLSYFKWNLFYAKNFALYEALDYGGEFYFFKELPYIVDWLGNFLIHPEEFFYMFLISNLEGSWGWGEATITENLLFVFWGLEFIAISFFTVRNFIKLKESKQKEYVSFNFNEI